jgi:site-specific recombinase XerD
MDATTLARWRTHLALNTTLSPNTINRMLSAVRTLMGVAAEQGYTTSENAARFEQVDGVRVQALKDRTRENNRTRIEPEDMKRLTEAPGTDTLLGMRDTALLHTFASSGLRNSELATLKVEQIVKRGRGYMVRVRGKNEKEFSETSLSVTAYEAIQAWLGARPVESEFVFTSQDGRGDRWTERHISSVSVWETVKKYAGRIGLVGVKPHDLRRFTGTQLAKKDIRKAQKVLRHKKITTIADHYVLDELEVGLTDNLY